MDCPEPSQGLTSHQAAPFVLLNYAANVTITGGGVLDAKGNKKCFSFSLSLSLSLSLFSKQLPHSYTEMYTSYVAMHHRPNVVGAALR